MRGITKLFTVLMIGASFALPSAALAQSSSEGAYSQPGGTVQDEIQTRPAQASDNTPAAATTPLRRPSRTPATCRSLDSTWP